ncbi:MAG TPA: pentapeptide repeat-containing protein, partial [Polyangia bacterium]|nr:pentapeptide repeat-containing protein [Polyangia bacterium]
LARANLARANLAGAYLAGANLAGADLADADLAGAYLAGADLADADLAGAYLAGANLADAYLAGAHLADADLARANLARANLADADLAGADLADADLADADLARADLARAKNTPPIADGSPASNTPAPALRTRDDWEKQRAENAAARAQRYRERHPDVPVVERLDARILQVVSAGDGRLEMNNWHSCETTHCRAGWAVHLAGAAGYELEKKHGPRIAGAMIYRASTGKAPHFFADNATALDDIKRCAAEQTGETVEAPAP